MPTCTQCRAEIAQARVCPFCHALQPIAQAGLGPGVTIDRSDSKLVIDAKIGEGGMGVVFRAWRFYSPGDPRASGGPKLVALKALRAHRAADPRLREYFRREAEALRVLSHPNIVQFEELFEHASASVLAMEFVDGEPLDSIIKRHKARATPHSIPCMPALRAVAYFEQLLGALASLHAMGIVHRDVKPQNILVRRDGIVKLTDFGIAKHGYGTPSTSKPTTEAGIAPGTGIYMSPEQVMGGALDGRSDLYSAAIVLYEMLAGRTPFSPMGKTEIAVRQEQLTETPPAVRSFFVQLPAPVDPFFARALAKDPNARFPDAIAMGTAARAAFGMPESAEWRALAEMVNHALLAAEPRAWARPTSDRRSDGAREPSAASPDTDRMGTLRDMIVQRYRTAPMPAKPG